MVPSSGRSERFTGYSEGIYIDVNLPDRYSCPLGTSSRLRNITLDSGRYLLGVQPHPSDTTPAEDRPFEVEMTCNRHPSGDRTAAPLDPSGGGVVVDPVTGRLTVSPAEGSEPGPYNLTLTAIDVAGASAPILAKEIEMKINREDLIHLKKCYTS